MHDFSPKVTDKSKSCKVVFLSFFRLPVTDAIADDRVFGSLEKILSHAVKELLNKLTDIVQIMPFFGLRF